MKSLIIYHSVQGNTEHVAQVVSDYLNADVIKIDGDRKIIENAVLSTPRMLFQVINRNQYAKALESVNLEDYHQIIIASPCWFYNMTPPIIRTLERVDFGDKAIYLMITHGGDIGNREKYRTNLKSGVYKGMSDYLFAKKMSNNEIIHKATTMLERL